MNGDWFICGPVITNSVLFKMQLIALLLKLTQTFKLFPPNSYHISVNNTEDDSRISVLWSKLSGIKKINKTWQRLIRSLSNNRRKVKKCVENCQPLFEKDTRDFLHCSVCVHCPSTGATATIFLLRAYRIQPGLTKLISKVETMIKLHEKQKKSAVN